MNNDLTIGFIQPDIFWEEQDKNLQSISAELDQMDTTAQLILLPEMFSTGFSMNPAKIAEPAEGKAWRFMKSVADRRKAVIAGSILTEENGHYFNRLYVIFPDGSQLHYDKRHLFRMSGEDKLLNAGTSRILFELNGWNILPLVCYDLRFPVWSRNRMIEGKYEYDLLLYVANWPGSRHSVWKSLLKARAIENLAFVAGVNRIGVDGEGLKYLGESMLFDAKGIIKFSGPKEKAGSWTVTISKNELEKFRKKFPVGYDWDRFTLEI